MALRGGFIRVDLSEWTCRSFYAIGTCEISGHRKAMAEARRTTTEAKAAPPHSSIAAAHRPAVAAVFPLVQRVLQLNVNLGQEVFGPAASASAAGTCSVTFGSFVPMSSLPICLHRPPECLMKAAARPLRVAAPLTQVARPLVALPRELLVQLNSPGREFPPGCGWAGDLSDSHPAPAPQKLPACQMRQRRRPWYGESAAHSVC